MSFKDEALEARNLGLVVFVSANPCKKCGGFDRYSRLTYGDCVQCRKVFNDQYRAPNVATKAKTDKAWRIANREYLANYQRAYRAKKKEGRLALSLC